MSFIDDMYLLFSSERYYIDITTPKAAPQDRGTFSFSRNYSLYNTAMFYGEAQKKNIILHLHKYLGKKNSNNNIDWTQFSQGPLEYGEINWDGYVLYWNEPFV